MSFVTNIDWSELSLQVVLTFGHFLWQACLVALVLFVVQHVAESLRDSWNMRLTQRCGGGNTQDVSLGETDLRGANIRYRLACIAFFSLPICVICTFVWVHQSRDSVFLVATNVMESTSHPMASVNEAIPLIANTDSPVFPPPEAPIYAEEPVTGPIVPSSLVVPEPSPTQRVQATALYLLLVYIVGVVALLTRFSFSIFGSSRLRRMVQPVAESNLLKIISQQSARLGLKNVPLVMLCQRVSVPVVVGIIKPMILLPPALVSGLDPHQLAAILSHEMAHIRRYDLIVNLLQRIFEALLFFHPVTWWISRRVSIERENCCDDAAASSCGRLEYASALLQMAEKCAAACGLKVSAQLDQLAANGSNNSQLAHRIKRLLGEDSVPRLSLTRSSLAAIVLVAIMGGVSMFAVAQSGGGNPATNSINENWGDESNGLQCRIVPVTPAMDAEKIDLIKSQTRFASPEEITFAVEIRNVSSAPIKLKDIRYGQGYAEETRGKLNEKHFAPHFFDFTFTSATGQPIPRTHREFELDSTALIVENALVSEIQPNESIKFLLQPAKFERRMEHRLPPSDYKVQVRYHGPSQEVLKRLEKHSAGREPENAWPNQVTSNQAAFSIAADGFRQPDLVWGAEKDGMRAALEIRVPRDSGIPTQAPGVATTAQLAPILHVKNVSDKAITFVSETGRQGDRLQIKTSEGKQVEVKDVFFTGWPIDVRWTLQPGEVAELDVLTPSLQQNLAPGSYKVRYTIRFNSRQSKDDQGNQTFPAPGDYQSEIDTGWCPLFLRDPNVGALSGRVSVEGSIPQLPKLRVASPNSPRFRSTNEGSVETDDESFLIDAERGLANAFVYLAKAPSGWKPTEEISESVTVTFQDSRIEPRAAIVRTGQDVRLINPGDGPDNFNFEPLKNGSQNRLVGAGSEFKLHHPFSEAERIPIRAKSNVNPWKTTYLLPLDHPFAAITDKQGRFSIEGLPPSEHEFHIWHERCGWLEKSLVVNIQSGKTTAIDKTYAEDRFRLGFVKPAIGNSSVFELKDNQSAPNSNKTIRGKEANDLANVKITARFEIEQESGTKSVAHKLVHTTTTTTNSTGAYSISIPDEISSLEELFVSLRLEQAGYLTYYADRLQLSAILESAPVVSLRKCRVLKGQVLLPNGSPAIGATIVTDSKYRPFSWKFPSPIDDYPGSSFATTNNSGNFELPTDPGGATLVVKLAGHAPLIIDDLYGKSIEDQPATVEPLVLRLPPAVRSGGVVQTHDGKPIGGAIVAIGRSFKWDEFNMLLSFTTSVASDELGNFELPPLPEDTYKLIAVARLEDLHQVAEYNKVTSENFPFPLRAAFLTHWNGFPVQKATPKVTLLNEVIPEQEIDLKQFLNRVKIPLVPQIKLTGVESIEVSAKVVNQTGEDRSDQIEAMIRGTLNGHPWHGVARKTDADGILRLIAPKGLEEVQIETGHALHRRAADEALQIGDSIHFSKVDQPLSGLEIVRPKLGKLKVQLKLTPKMYDEANFGRAPINIVAQYVREGFTGQKPVQQRLHLAGSKQTGITDFEALALPDEEFILRVTQGSGEVAAVMLEERLILKSGEVLDRVFDLTDEKTNAQSASPIRAQEAIDELHEAIKKDPNNLHATALYDHNPMGWKWRVYLPPGSV